MCNGELIKWAIVLITIKYTSNAEMLVNHVSYKYQKLFLYRVQPNELDIKKNNLPYIQFSRTNKDYKNK